MKSLTTLESKLERISELEEKFGIVGVSFAVEDGATVSTEDSADYVIRAIERGVKFLSNLESIPLSRIGRQAQEINPTGDLHTASGI